MIEINLLPGKKGKRKAAAGLALPDFKAMLAQVKDPLLLGAVGAWVVVIAAVAFLYVTESRKLTVMQADVDRVQAEALRFQALINQKKREESLRDSLVNQFDAIRRIDGDRYVWPHILEEITKALPDYTWLESITYQQGAVTDTSDSARSAVRVLIDGRTADMGGYTRFLRQLADSPWLTSVVAGPTKTVVENDKPVLSFTVTVTYRQADSAFIRTAPAVRSVQ
jgi:Tfp pilus assembly protein PilN